MYKLSRLAETLDNFAVAYHGDPANKLVVKNRGIPIRIKTGYDKESGGIVHYQVRIFIRAPRELVFDITTNPAMTPLWIESVEKETLTVRGKERRIESPYDIGTMKSGDKAYTVYGYDPNKMNQWALSWSEGAGLYAYEDYEQENIAIETIDELPRIVIKSTDFYTILNYGEFAYPGKSLDPLGVENFINLKKLCESQFKIKKIQNSK